MAAVRTLTVTQHDSSTDSDTAWQQYWQRMAAVLTVSDTAWQQYRQWHSMAAVLPVTVTQAASHCRTQMENNKRYETAKSPEITIRTAQRSLYVPYSGHYMYRTVVTICTAQWSLYVPHSGHYMYGQFNIQQFHVLPTHCIYVFCVDLRTNSHYFPIQH